MGDRSPLALSLLCLLAPGPAAAGAQEDFRIWGNVTSIANLGSLDPRLDRWRWWMEGQGRWRDGGDALDQGLVRTGVGYALTDRASVWLGYAYVPTLPEARRTINEHRIWQQLTLTDFAPFGDLTSRSRLEQRFIQGIDPVEWRFREFVRFSRPIAEGSPFSFILWDEVFVRLNSTTPTVRTGFDQNRGFAGIGYSFDRHARLEVGYLNQLVQTFVQTRTRRATDLRMNHILSTSLFLNF
ncbi:MAG: DUF2490 domain-containing protein [Alphaproteobacteria bacterium]|nr:DUF2490 domain-containing protein [Alphaproteobacteria bacterium]